MVKYPDGILNQTFAALADPTRRSILQQLSQGGDCRVTDIAKPHAMSLPAVSKHLRVLEEARLITRTRQGRVHSLALNAAPMRQAQAWIESYRVHWEASLDRLEDYLDELQSGGSAAASPSPDSTPTPAS